MVVANKLPSGSLSFACTGMMAGFAFSGTVTVSFTAIGASLIGKILIIMNVESLNTPSVIIYLILSNPL